MPSVINDSCIKCGVCASVCPVSAMHLASTQMVIDPEVCIDCGACIAECPQEAITSDSEASPETVKFNAEQAKISPNAED